MTEAWKSPIRTLTVSRSHLPSRLYVISAPTPRSFIFQKHLSPPNPNIMNAFVTPVTSACTARPRAVASCSSRPAAAPFFASVAFGTPLQTRVSTPAARAPVRMDVTIVVGDNEPVESALRRFKKDVSKSGHLFELRRRRYFETNTEKRIRKAAAARRKAKMTRMDNRNNGADSRGSSKSSSK